MRTVEKLSASQAFLLKHWLAKCGENDNALPSIEDLDINEANAHFDKSVIFEKNTKPDDFKYRFIGKKITPSLHKNYTGKKLSELSGKGAGSKIWNFLSNTLNAGTPLIEAVPYAGPDNVFSHTSLVGFPLAASKTEPQMVLLGVNFEKWSFLKEETELENKVSTLRTLLGEIYADESIK